MQLLPRVTAADRRICLLQHTRGIRSNLHTLVKSTVFHGQNHGVPVAIWSPTVKRKAVHPAALATPQGTQHLIAIFRSRWREHRVHRMLPGD